MPCDAQARHRLHAAALCAVAVSTLWSATARADEPADYLGVVRRYADTMIERGRDSFGPEKGHVFLSALDRRTLAPLTTRPAAPAGVREGDRCGPAGGPLVGANPQTDENLYRILYALSDVTGDERYRDAADEALQWFLTSTASPRTRLLPWGEHLSWNTLEDEVASAHPEPMHEFARPWVLWDRCFDLAPDASRNFAAALWNVQVGDRMTGAFDRHAHFDRYQPRTGHDFPRHGGFYIATWAQAYARTKERTFLTAIDTLVARFERKRHPETGLINAWADEPIAWPPSELSLAIDCHRAADLVPDPFAGRLRNFAAREDEVFLALGHEPAGRGFVVTTARDNARPLDKDKWEAHSTPWGAAYGNSTTGMLALMCLARYEQENRPEYRELIVAAGDAYCRADLDTDRDLWPMPVGHAISTLLAAHLLTSGHRGSGFPPESSQDTLLAPDRSTSGDPDLAESCRPAADENGEGAAPKNVANDPDTVAASRPAGVADYLTRGRHLADRAVEIFWGGCPLPRASSRSDHYESITGADTLALALLHLAMIDRELDPPLPPNTIDR
jgi:hypothetical protein